MLTMITDAFLARCACLTWPNKRFTTCAIPIMCATGIGYMPGTDPAETVTAGEVRQLAVDADLGPGRTRGRSGRPR